MFQKYREKYREISWGLLFGLGAVILDTLMHAQMTDRSFWAESINPQPAMILYRVLFVLFGLALGWLLWQKNKRERDFRQLADTLASFQRDLSAPALLMHAELQVLLMKEESQLSPEAAKAVRFAYEKSQEIHALVKETIPSQSSS